MAERKARNNITKTLPNSDKTVKNGKKESQTVSRKEGKKVDKGFVIAIILCVAVALGVVGIIVLPEPITASIKLNEVKKFIANSTELTVVINAPMESEGILNDKEAVIRDGDATAFAEKLTDVLESIKYSDTSKVEAGIWKTKLVLYNTTEECRIYVDSDSVYIENNGKLIKYKIAESAKVGYDSLYSEINTALE